MSSFKVITRAFIMVFLLAFAACSTPITATPTTPALAREITLYGWPDDISPEAIAAFTKETGVKVNYIGFADTHEAAYEEMRQGKAVDVMDLSNDLVAQAISDKLLTPLNFSDLPNFKNISPNFRDLSFDAGNKYSVPFNWGAVALIVRKDLVGKVKRWADVWALPPEEKILMYTEVRKNVGAALHVLGYSINSEKPGELDAAARKLGELGGRVIFSAEDMAVVTAQYASSAVGVGLGGESRDFLDAQAAGAPFEFVYPEDGVFLWGDNFVIPASSPNAYTAHLFLNFMMRPETGVQLVTHNLYATPNDATIPLLPKELRENPYIFPPKETLKNNAIVLPLTPATTERYNAIWNAFFAANKGNGL